MGRLTGDGTGTNPNRRLEEYIKGGPLSLRNRNNARELTIPILNLLNKCLRYEVSTLLNIRQA